MAHVAFATSRQLKTASGRPRSLARAERRFRRGVASRIAPTLPRLIVFPSSRKRRLLRLPDESSGDRVAADRLAVVVADHESGVARTARRDELLHVARFAMPVEEAVVGAGRIGCPGAGVTAVKRVIGMSWAGVWGAVAPACDKWIVAGMTSLVGVVDDVLDPKNR